MSAAPHGIAAGEPAAPSALRAWWRAIRPHTLGGALAPVAVGSAVAYGAGRARPGVALLCAAAALLLQIAANLANDAFDSLHGIDGAQRIGPRRAVQAGWLSAQAVLAASALALALAAACGVYLVWLGGAVILALGLASIAAAWGYSSGPFPLASHGLGEVAAFVFFGLVAVCGTSYLQLGELTPRAAVAALPVAALISNLMLVNNLRDLASDAAAGKRTLAVRLGARAARALYAALLVLAYGAPLLFCFGLAGGPQRLLPWATLPWGWQLARAVARAETPADYQQLLVRSARLHVATSVLLALGLVV